MELKPIKSAAPKVPERVMESLLSAMETGILKVGEDLPTERDLTSSLGISRGSLRECLAILEYLSIIETHGNRKVVVRDAKYFQKAVAFLQLANRDNILTDTVEFRRAVEISSAQLACERATEEDLARMADALRRWDEGECKHEADVDFHQGLAMASHNVMFISSMDLLSSIIMDTGLRYYKMPKYDERTRQSHHKIYEAIRARDKVRAAEEIEAHLQLVYDFTGEAIETGMVEDD